MMNTSKHIGMLAILIACICVGCGDSKRTKLVGDWGIERPESVMRKLSDSNDPDAAGAPEREPESSPMLLKFHSNGVLETSTQMGSVKQKKSGRWKFVSFDDSTQSMAVSCEIQDQKTEQVITFIDPDTIELVPPNMAGLTMKLRFKRQ